MQPLNDQFSILQAWGGINQCDDAPPDQLKKLSLYKTYTKLVIKRPLLEKSIEKNNH